jgi:hypothetical protein
MDTGQRVATIFAIVLAVVILCAGSGYAGYAYYQMVTNSANEGNTYTTGLQIGKEIGYQSGYQAALDSIEKQKAAEIKLHDPTYREMKDFLVRDTTNKLPYVQNQRICTDFATEVDNNAKKQGINCAIVYILYGETGHSIVAFNTVDKGLIFIEPQFDDEVTLPIGKSYSQNNRYVKQDAVDDTIIRYMIAW